MAEGTGEEAGEVVNCPGCGRPVKQHSMIPVHAGGSDAPGYLCIDCARQHIVAATGAAED